MPTNLTIPFIIAPPADLLTTHPDLKRLAADLSLKYIHPRIHQRVVTDDDLKTIGDALWHALDETTALEKAFAAALQRAGQKVLPILIQTDQPALLALPWECLHHPEQGFLARLKGFTLSRVGCGEPSGEPHQLTSRIALKGDVGCGEPSGEPHQRTPDFIDAVRAKRSPASYPLPPPSYGDFLRYWQELAKESNTTARHGQPAGKHRVYRALGGNFKGLELFTNRYGLDQEVAANGDKANGDKEGKAKREEQFLTHLESAKTELRAYMAVAQVVDWLEPEPTQLLTRLRVYGNPVIIDGVQAITLDLPGWKAALERLAMLSLVDVDLDLRLDLPRYRVTPLVADWLQETKRQLPVELRERAARYQQWALENLEKTMGQAQAYYTRALLVTREIGDRAGEGAILNNIATIHQTKGDVVKALDYLTRSLTILREIDNQAGLCATLFNMGNLHLGRKEPQAAQEHLVAAYRIAREIGYAQVLSALKGLAHQFGVPEGEDGLAFWEKVANGEMTVGLCSSGE